MAVRCFAGISSKPAPIRNICAAVKICRAAVNARPDAALFRGGHVSVQQSGRGRERAADSVPSKPVEELVRDYLLKKRISVSHGCSLFRRDILEACPYPEHLRSCEDI